jgi:hypothetical protein
MIEEQHVLKSLQFEDQKAINTQRSRIRPSRIESCPNKHGVSKFCYALAISNKVHGSSIKSCPLLHLSANVSTQNQPSMPCPCENRTVVVSAAHLEHQRSTLGFLVTTITLLASLVSKNCTGRRISYPSSKCLHRFNANCAFVLHAVHSNLNTTFFVVLAFL